MAEQQEFDSRFDPAFQRGYVPPAKPQRTPSAARPADGVHSPSADSVPPPDGEPQQIREPQSPTEPQAQPGSPPPQEPQRDVPTEATTDLRLAVRRGINPYIVILWIVGVVFSLGGATLLFAGHLQAFTALSAGPAASASAQGLYVLGTTFGGPLITVGLATIAGLIFFLAWHSWRRHDGSNS
jgi:hypothetical protein